MRVMYYDMIRREDLEQSMGITFADLDTVIREADFVSIHTPLTPETRHLMNAERFKMMKKTAILINSARGPIVDTMALNDALRSGTIAGAGLDVTDPEPIPMDHPLLGAPNCVIAPHIASASVVTRSKMSEIAAGNIINGLTRRADARAAEPGQGRRRPQVGSDLADRPLRSPLLRHSRVGGLRHVATYPERRASGLGYAGRVASVDTPGCLC